jgi:hypothetical protein
VDLQLDGGRTDMVTGTVSDGTWTADLLGYRAVFNASTLPAPQAGKYTMLLPGDNGMLGSGYGLVTIGSGGSIVMSGLLGDGVAVVQSTSLSADGLWPVYATLYANNGLLHGWVTITNRGTNSVEGQLVWLKSSGLSGNIYPNGMNTEIDVVGSTYIPPATGSRALPVTNGIVLLSNGNLSYDMTNSITLSSANLITVTPAYTNKLVLSINAGLGTIGGSFRDPVSHLTRTIKGVLLQQQTNAQGFFLDSDRSGDFLLRP